MPATLRKIITYIAEITLEIYVVQQAIIRALADRLSFPLNRLILTLTILASATALHYLSKVIEIGAGRMFGSVRDRIKGKSDY